ncbi:hypothetical protein V5O48_008630 [Marasmius crinis-equi]|uniref:Bromodomain associated domain-containing protein n=1 Tax=Marasmius crinis-equi TaxID=585013 RepID=A0ABR3FDI8_9AGAR
MDSGAHKLLESATHRTLHAHNFSRSSSQASLVLTDLVSRYLHLLASTCAKYAEHAGRRQLTAKDAALALDELGVSIEELREYGGGEGIELNRYTLRSMRRAEDLAEFRAQLNDGLRGDRDDAMVLNYAPLPPEYESEEEEDEEDEDMDENGVEDNDVSMEFVGQKRQPSPLSSPTSPKRHRTLAWDPPPHVPDFLPPFPKPVDAVPLSASHSPRIPEPLLDPENPATAENSATNTTLATQEIAAATTSSAASDYLVPVPYSGSSLSSVPEWHLPGPPPRTSSLSLQSQPQQQRWPTPLTEPSLFGAYHHILTQEAPVTHQANPARHKVAMALLNLTQTQPRWEIPDTLYSNVATNQPRIAPIPPTFPMAIGENPEKEKEKKEIDLRLPPSLPRTVAANDRLSLSVAQQGSRIPELARHVLSPTIFGRTTRLTHPSVLFRGTKQLIYGSGVPAPWNTHVVSSSNDPRDGGGAGSGVNGIGRSDPAAKNAPPDARLFATWDYEAKDYRAPLPASHLKKGRIGGQGVGVALGARGRSASTKTG